MGRAGKVGVVAGGYGAAFAAGAIAAWWYDVRMAAQPYDTSGGMYAAGQSMTAMAAFLLVALVPTLLALWFLRRNEKFWKAVAIAAIAFAAVGLVAVLAAMANRGAGHSIPLMVLELLGLAQLLGVPLWLAGFALFAFLAPTRTTRRMMIAALAIEAIIGVCAVFHWFLRTPH